MLSNSQLTPIKKLLKNLSLLRSQTPSKRPIVLLTTGSMNPIHKQHYNIFELAKRELESKLPEAKVIAGYISPSQDLYVEGKLGKYAIPINDRIEMCKLAVQESDWIDVDLWESKSIENSEWFIDFWRVVHRLSRFLTEHYEINCNNIKVYYLCGDDHVIRTGVKGLNNHGIAIVGRKNNKENWVMDCKNRLDRVYSKGSWKEFVIFVSGEGNINISSTIIREKLISNESGWEDFCDQNVVEYIKKNGILSKKNKKVWLFL